MDEKELWVQFALAGAASIAVSEDVDDDDGIAVSEDVDDDDVADATADLAIEFADAMLEEYKARFMGGPAKPKRKAKRRASAVEE
jgi:hypothetical protein